MGIVKLEDGTKTELEEFRRMLLASAAGDHRRNKEPDGGDIPSKIAATDGGDLGRGRPVCVTSGLSYLGVAVAERLLLRGYSVRLVVDSHEDLERIEEMELKNGNVRAIMARITEQESLEEAFKGCGGVFHTSSFIDPNGLSGYTKYMVDVEAQATENVIKACAKTSSVKKCVMTSSLLACVWRDTSGGHQESSSLIINQDCWSDDSLCVDKKLWYALGKLRAEKAAWRVAEENGLNMATICPALITGSDFCSRNSTPTFAYLKGAEEMYKMGVLASVDVNRLADAHVSVFEALNKPSYASGGRYICYDNVVRDEYEAEKLATETGLSMDKICGHGGSTGDLHRRFRLSDRKLSSLMSTVSRPCYNQSRNS